MTTLAPEDPQRRQEEQAANLLKDLFAARSTRSCAAA